MRAFIINLEFRIDRKNHMIDLLSELGRIDYEFISACDGRKLTEYDIKRDFNIRKFREINAYEPFKQEIGCTLSHRECYNRISESSLDFAIVLEDDVIIDDFDEIQKIVSFLADSLLSNKPYIILLSGNFWYYKKNRILNNYHMCSITDGFYAYGYLINKAAANVMLQEKPYYVADDWRTIRNMGIEVIGISPHLIDISSLGEMSNIQGQNRIVYKKNFTQFMNITAMRLRKKFLQWVGLFESLR